MSCNQSTLKRTRLEGAIEPTNKFIMKPWLVASEVYPSKKAFANQFYYYSYKTLEAAEKQLMIIKALLGDNHPELREKARVIENRRYPDTPYRFLLSVPQERDLSKLQGHPRLVKSIRWDVDCFIEDFILGITPSEKKRHRQKLRPGRHKKYTVFPDGPHAYNKRPSPYPKNNLDNKKSKRSQHQSTSLVSHKTPSPVFGHNTGRSSKLAGFIVDADDALVNRRFVYDGGTVNRPYEHHTKQAAIDYHARVTDAKEPLLFASRDAFEQALEKQPGKFNEVMARIRWKVNSSAIGIFNNVFEARAVAYYYAERTYQRVKEQYKESNIPWCGSYQIPIVYYLPNHQRNWTRYTAEDLEKDKRNAQDIYQNDKMRQQYIAKNQGEFLLLLDNPRTVWESLLHDNSAPLFTMIEQEQFHLLEALYQRANFDEPLEKKLIPPYDIEVKFTSFWKAAEKNKLYIINFCKAFSFSRTWINMSNGKGKTPLHIAAKNGHLDVVKALFDVNGFSVNMVGELLRRDGYGWNALMLAARYNPKAVSPILKSMASTNQPDQMVEMLLGTNRYGWSALSLAAICNPKAVALILNAMANTNQPNKMVEMLLGTSSSGWNALMLAAQDNPKAVDPILRAMANTKQPDKMVEMLLGTSSDGWNALMVAAQYNPKAVDPILSAMENTNQPNKMVEMLLSISHHGDNVLKMLENQGNEGNTDASKAFINYLEACPVMIFLDLLDSNKNFKLDIIPKSHAEFILALKEYLSTKAHIYSFLGLRHHREFIDKFIKNKLSLRKISEEIISFYNDNQSLVNSTGHFKRIFDLAKRLAQPEVNNPDSVTAAPAAVALR